MPGQAGKVTPQHDHERRRRVPLDWLEARHGAGGRVGRAITCGPGRLRDEASEDSGVAG